MLPTCQEHLPRDLCTGHPLFQNIPSPTIYMALVSFNSVQTPPGQAPSSKHCAHSPFWPSPPPSPLSASPTHLLLASNTTSQHLGVVADPEPVPSTPAVTCAAVGQGRGGADVRPGLSPPGSLGTGTPGGARGPGRLGARPGVPSKKRRGAGHQLHPGLRAPREVPPAKSSNDGADAHDAGTRARPGHSRPPPCGLRSALVGEEGSRGVPAAGPGS